MAATAGSIENLTAGRLSSKKRKRLLLKVLATLFGLWLATSGALFAVMCEPPEAFARVMSHLTNAAFFVFPFETLWTRARAGNLQPGDLAPDFSLLKLDKTASIRLSALTAQTPVVLVFGSYT
jgi:hypothetical protein